MAMSLTQPVIGSTGWGAAVNTNFQSLEDFCNNVSNALRDAVPVFVGANGSPGAAGLVPPPAAGDDAAGKLLAAGGGWRAVPVMIGDGGSGGMAGLVPAPVGGDAGKFLRGDGTFAAVAGGTLVYCGRATLSSGHANVVVAGLLVGSLVVASYSQNGPTRGFLVCIPSAFGGSVDVYSQDSAGSQNYGDNNEFSWLAVISPYNP